MSMDIQKYFEQKKELYNQVLLFIENSESDELSQQYISDIIQNIKSQKIEENQEELKHFINLLVSIANNHHRQSGFFDKLEKIIQHIREGMAKTMKNPEIYELFESNKRLLLYLIKEEIIIFDDEIARRIYSKFEKNGLKYSEYFQPEMKKFTKYDVQEITLSESKFDEKRLEGENDSLICSLIRQDSVVDFISYVNRSNISLSSWIEPSIFETNSFLNENETTLIEYAAFYGSIEIFQYLYLSNAKVTGSIWEYAIHSNNSDFILHNIKDYQIEPKDSTYKSTLIESIKCHHNDIANYIENNLLIKDEDEDKNQQSFSDEIIEIVFQSYNYSYFPNDFDSKYSFFYLCQQSYSNIVKLLLEMKKDYIESEMSIIIVLTI